MISDAAQHMAGKEYFCKLDCSQVYHCIQMADEQSVQLLSLNFGSTTFAYERSTQDINRSLSAFISRIRENLDPAVRTDRCALYVEDFGAAAHTSSDLIENLDTCFHKLKKQG